MKRSDRKASRMTMARDTEERSEQARRDRERNLERGREASRIRQGEARLGRGAAERGPDQDRPMSETFPTGEVGFDSNTPGRDTRGEENY